MKKMLGWFRLEYDDDTEPEMTFYQKCWMVGFIIAVVAACLIGSEVWKPFVVMLAIGLAIILVGAWSYVFRGASR